MGWFGFPPRHEERRDFDRLSRRRLARLVEEALDELGWAWRDEGKYAFTVSFGWSFGSYGETMTIEVDKEEVWARSQTSFPLTWIDWGKNESNVRRFFRMLEDIQDEEGR